MQSEYVTFIAFLRQQQLTQTWLNLKFICILPLLLCVDIANPEIFVQLLLTEDVIIAFYDMQQ
jgi:hypothetical protein